MTNETHDTMTAEAAADAVAAEMANATPADMPEEQIVLIPAETIVKTLIEQAHAWNEVEPLINSGVLVTASVVTVAGWHEMFGVPVLDEPANPPAARAELRLSLLREELGELEVAIQSGDLVKIADALTDLQVVLDGTFVEFGMGRAKQALFEEVMRANLSKLGAGGQPILREDGKVMKGPNYTPPDIARVLADVYSGGGVTDAAGTGQPDGEAA